jgi:hypothetical protein
LSDTEVAKFSAQRYRFPGVEVKARLFRQYPMGHVASHAIGYIGRITERDLKWIEEAEKLPNYKGTDHIGKTGLEQHYEFELHGETGYEQVEIDAGGRALRSLKRIPPVSGNNLQLTLDIKLQEITEKAFGDRKGALVAIDPAPAVSWPWCRPRPTTPTCSWTASHRRTGRAERAPRQADDQPYDQRCLPARLDLQALHGAGRAGNGQAHAATGDQ